MTRTLTLGSLALVLGTLIAGCTAEEGGTPQGLAGIDDDSGAIVGLVLDESQLPVAGVEMSLVNTTDESILEQATSLEDGTFTFSRVAPGVYDLRSFALGYVDTVQSVEIQVGQVVSDVLIQLVQGRTDTAFHITDFLKKMVGGGMVKATPDCMFIDLTPYGSPVGPGVTKTCQGANACLEEVGCADGANGCMGGYSGDGGYREFLENNTNWQTILREVDWRPTSAVSGRGVLHEMLGPNVTGAGRCGSINQQDPRDFMVISDQPPIRTVIDDALMQERGIDPVDRCCDWRQRLFPAWCDLGNCDRFGPDLNVAGIVAPTPVEIYISIFIKEPTPPDWTALPDAA